MNTSAFSRAALHANIDQTSKEPMPPLEVQAFLGQEDFQIPDAEESIWFLRGSKEDYRDAVHFWLKALQLVLEQSVPHRPFGHNSLYDEDTLCKEISLQEFTEILQWQSGLKTQHNFHLHGQFQQAWVMSNSPLDKSALAVTDGEFVAFFWDTTA